MSKLKLYLLSLALFAALISAVLGVTELILCWTSASGSEERRDHVEETEYLPARSKPNYEGQFWGVKFRTNNLGFRDEPDMPLEPDEGEIRILSLGDSIGFGLGVPGSDHYTKVAQRKLNLSARLKPFHLINAGGQGYSPSSYSVYLRHEGLKLRPDLVLVETELCNDVTDEALLRWKLDADTGLPEAIVGGRYVVGWDGNLLGTYSVGSYWYEKTYLHTILARRMLNLLSRAFGPTYLARVPGARVYYSLGFDEYLLDQKRLEEGWNRLFSALVAARRFSEDAGARFLLMIMPSRYLYEDAGEYCRTARQLFERALSRARVENFDFLDMSIPIAEQGGANLFFDFAHLTVEGNRVVGEALAKRVSSEFPETGRSPVTLDQTEAAPAP